MKRCVSYSSTTHEHINIICIWCPHKNKMAARGKGWGTLFPSLIKWSLHYLRQPRKKGEKRWAGTPQTLPKVLQRNHKQDQQTTWEGVSLGKSVDLPSCQRSEHSDSINTVLKFIHVGMKPFLSVYWWELQHRQCRQFPYKWDNLSVQGIQSKRSRADRGTARGAVQPCRRGKEKQTSAWFSDTFWFSPN